MSKAERRYTLRPAEPADADFACEVKLRGLQRYVEAIAAWDEERQRAAFLENYDHATTRVVQVDGEDVGVLCLQDRGEEVHLAEIYLAEAARNLGLGSEIVRDVVHSAHSAGRGVTLQLLRTNPVVRLYERLGFRISGETQTHFRMECPVPEPSSVPPEEGL